MNVVVTAGIPSETITLDVDRLPVVIRDGVLRAFVIARDGYACRRCSFVRRLHVHHRIPREYGGIDSAGNLTTLCDGCHQETHRALNALVKLAQHRHLLASAIRPREDLLALSLVEWDEVIWMVDA